MSKSTLVALSVLTLLSTRISLPARGVRPAQTQQIETLIGQFAQHNWQEAVEALAKIGEPAVQPLIVTLRDRNVKQWTVHARAIETLGRIGTPAAVDAVIEALANKELNQYARGLAAAALAAHDSEKSVQALVCAAKDPAQFVRWKAVQSLGKMTDSAAVDALISALKDEDQDVRAAAVTSLGEVGSAGATEAVVHALTDDHWLVRLDARNVLVEAQELPVDSLIMALKNRKSQARWQAAAILGRTKTANAAKPLINALEDPDWMVLDQAAVALTRIASDEAVRLLTEAALLQTSRASEPAGWALGKIRDSDSAASGEVSADPYRQPVRPPRNMPQYDNYSSSPVLGTKPDFPSPFLTPDGVEMLAVFAKDSGYKFVPVTIENCDPLNYKQSQWGKGRQLSVDAADFPTLAATGLHSEAELARTKTITDRSIVEITELGRPERSSGAGFMAADEDIVSVLKGDNEIVKALGLTHPQTAVPLFHVWNIVLEGNRRNLRFGTEPILYNGARVEFAFEGSKGWQESIFDDEILGRYQFALSRQLSEDELSLLNRKYSHLSSEQKDELIKKLSQIHTGEMMPYYIMRYGFYEGHSDYRADPIAIAFIFGLRTLEQIETAFEGRLYEALTQHFTGQLARP